MKISRKIYCFLLVISLNAALFSGCNFLSAKQDEGFTGFTSFREIPSVTKEEIAAVDALREKGITFIYGAEISTEIFIDNNGEIKGFTALLCEWLTELFEIRFEPRIYSWNELLDGLESGEIDFTGDLTATDERRFPADPNQKPYFMTDPIAQRTVRYFRLANAEPLSEIEMPRFALFNGTTTVTEVTNALGAGNFIPVLIDDYDEAYGFMVSGEADALITENVGEAAFDEYEHDVAATDFLPLLFSPVSLSTRNGEREVIINIIQKALENNTAPFLNELYKQGYKVYRSHKLSLQFSPEEREYIKNNPAIPFAPDTDNYPISFYNTRQNQWQGIAHDVLAEVTALTGLEFEIAVDVNTDFVEMLRKLEEGEVYLLSEVFPTPVRRERFLWPDKPLLSTNLALLSTTEHPNISIIDIFSQRVGLQRGTLYHEMFFRWFPDHNNNTIYDNQIEMFDALLNNEIDLVMHSTFGLLHLTNYQELAGFKANLIFDAGFDSKFGINKEQEILLSIFNKTLEVVNVEAISGKWLRKTYDYRVKVMEAQRPWLIGMAALSLLILIITALLYRNHAVKSRTIARQASRIDAIINNLPGMVYQSVCNPPDYTNTFVSDGVFELLGYTPEEYRAIPFDYNISYPDDVEFVNRTTMKALMNRQPVENVYRLITKDGKIKWVWERCRAIEYNKDGTPYLIEGYFTDITERFKLEETKREKQQIELNYEYVEKLSDTLASITKSPTITAGNIEDAAKIIAQEACRVLNTTYVGIWIKNDEKNALENITCYDFKKAKHFVLDDFDLTNRQTYANLLETERLIVTNNIKTSATLANLTEDYGPDLCALIDVPIRIDGKLAGTVCIEQEKCEDFKGKRDWTIEEQSFSSSLADLMSLAITGAERRAAREAAEAANRAKSEFLAVMSHEIRTPMNSILGFAELVLDNPNSPHVRSYSEKIVDGTKWLLHIINDILDISKIESGKMEIEKVPFNLYDIISRCQSVMLPAAKEKGLELNVYVEPHTGRKLLGDPVRLYQVLINLLSNAVKFTAEGSINLSALVKSTENNNITTYFEVKDTGIGMTSAQIDKILEPFVQADSSTTRNYGGTGLGLAIVKNIVELMNGRTLIESAPGKGTAIGFEITFETIEVSDEPSEAVKVILEKPSFGGLVLICDDNRMNQEVICEHLSNVGLKTIVADNGEIGVEKVRERLQRGEKPFDLIFMDMYMPVMDGIEAAKKISALNTGAPMVAMTANIMVSELEKYRKHGMPDCLNKPFTSQELWRILLKYLTPAGAPEAFKIPAAPPPEEDDDFLRRTRISFAEKNQNVYTEIMEAIASDNITTAHRLAHTLKSNAGTIGKPKLQKAAAAVEKFLKNDIVILGDNERKLLHTLKTEFNAVTEELKPLLAEALADSAEKPPALTAEQTLELFGRLEPMLRDINGECISLLGELRAVSGAEELVKQIADYDFRTALKTLEGLKETAQADLH